MKFNTALPKGLKPYFNAELSKYRSEYSNGNLKFAWSHLERAHILGQKYPLAHSYVHWKMLQFGFKVKSGKEIFGQIPRLVFGGIKSFVGTIPTGNPGGANVPALKAFPIEEELKDVFRSVGVNI